jgi:hypothetical protein
MEQTGRGRRCVSEHRGAKFSVTSYSGEEYAVMLLPLSVGAAVLSLGMSARLVPYERGQDAALSCDAEHLMPNLRELRTSV